MMTGKKRFLRHVRILGKVQIQRLFITLQFFGENGLANHAAAGAYGFLLSAAPTLLLVSFFLLAAFRSSPEAVFALIREIPFLNVVLDQDWLMDDFLALSRPGISGLISGISIFWAGRVFAVSLQRGLKVIFSGAKNRNPVIDNLITLLIELLVLIFALVMILCSRTALRLYNIFPFLPGSFLVSAAAKIRYRIFPIIALGLISYCAYRIVPSGPPRRLSALYGTVFCVICYTIVSIAMGILLDQTRYNFLYGALGNLVVLLVNVYFFFAFFFFGAQLAFVIDSFDALLFSRRRKARMKTSENRRVPGPVKGRLEKYIRCYVQGEIIFSKGDSSGEIFYLLEGEVDMYMPGVSGSAASTLGPDSFFGEMGHLLSEDRSATVQAKTGVSALALPPRVFDEILKYDAGLDRVIIEQLSRRLKLRNEQLSALSSSADH